ncbi:DUF6037 family protein [Yersinia ruckeri]|uniref:DUF6037 family protein n=1 Tax=Yersinia ruckeri TaxID=29486 RepID=UPI0004E3CC7E|nr:DUF6037 family protein [Yersinia ruckeri]ARZ01330.1 hypothetical protein QMA0440_01997 [Yersinia ruckeri]EKN4197658.1 hypothetical protein [Yersinia ruckeri]EKN4203910.1 hypothetical protein [Yersinia ruckeri]EKN4701070.1 hypothetical protein [Yersinia ruckeri]EKN4704991.1 hypothetical protein [Yersinia ruckeri]
MKLEGLKELYKDMKRNNVSRDQFQYKHNNVTFDIILFIDDSPFQLLFGAIGHQCSFFVNVLQGFKISPVITPKSAYYDLCKALGLTYDPANPFSTNKFFSDFALHIPSSISTKKASILPVNYQALVNDDGKKTHFSHWKNNSDKSGNVTDDNLKKTYDAFGAEIKNFCRRKNISSCWSVKDKKSKK